jgi:LPS export ABC transporter protein LptC
MVFIKSPGGASKSTIAGSAASSAAFPPVLVAAFLALIMFIASCSLAEESVPIDQDELADVIFYNYRREDMDKTGLSFIAQAERAEYFKDKGLLVVYGLSFEDIGEDGKTVIASGEAETAYYYEDTGDAQVKGSVRIHSLEDDASFETDSLKYFAATESLEGGPENPVLVRVGEELFLQGSGFFADVREKSFAFSGGVEGMIQNNAVRNLTKE